MLLLKFLKKFVFTEILLSFWMLENYFLIYKRKVLTILYCFIKKITFLLYDVVLMTEKKVCDAEDREENAWGKMDEKFSKLPCFMR